ncbi:MAG TPA: YfiR family protein [Tepidisphaeraceae bacterium]|nr:YfiR family protein [Tepidisphaeraceae bacterium]
MLTVALRPGVLEAGEANREYALKAAFLYNFAQFVEWPAGAFESDTAPFVIGVYGDNPFQDALDRAVQGKTASGHPMVVHQFSTTAEVASAHMLFVSAAQGGALDELFAAIGDRPILTVGESNSFPWKGGVIRFYMEDGKVRFEINPEAAQRARLRISSKLMKLARIFKR